MMSPERTARPPQTMGAPTAPGPLAAGEVGTMPAAKTGRPTARMPALSRARPSVTKAAMPMFFIMPATMSPKTAAPR